MIIVKITPRNHNRRAANRRVSQNKPPMRQGPPQLKTNLELKHQFRFTSTSDAAQVISDINLLAAAGVSVDSTGTNGSAIWQTVKVNKIEIWSPPPSQGANATCSVLFPATNNSQAREYTDTSVSVATPAHVQCSPPPRSLCGFWQVGEGAHMFTLTAPPGSIIDVWLSLVLNDGTPPSSVTATLVGATFGDIVYCSLDSTTSAGSVYKPIGLTTA